MKTPAVHLRTTLVLGVAVVTVLIGIRESRAQSQNPVSAPLILPPLSVPRAQFFKNNPAAWSQFLSRLPHREPGAPRPAAQRPSPSFGGTWQTVNNFLPGGVYVSNPLLLTDGTVIAENESKRSTNALLISAG
jgi:hypothetical protein